MTSAEMIAEVLRQAAILASEPGQDSRRAVESSPQIDEGAPAETGSALRLKVHGGGHEPVTEPYQAHDEC